MNYEFVQCQPFNGLCFEINKAVFGLLEFVFYMIIVWITKRCEGGMKYTATADDSKGE